MQEIKLSEVLDEIESFPPLPTNFNKLFEMMKDPNLSYLKLEKEIAFHQSLVVKILKMANSAFYGYSVSTSKISEGIKRIGMEVVRRLAYIEMVKSSIPGDLPFYGITAKDLWMHSVKSAVAGQFLAQKKASELSNEAFMAGLLIDSGKIVIDKYLEQNSLKLEQTDLDKKYGAIGGLLLKNWNFQDTIVEAITHHQKPEESENNSMLTIILHISNLIAMSTESEELKKTSASKISPRVMKMLNLDFSQIIDLLNYVYENTQKAAQAWLSV